MGYNNNVSFAQVTEWKDDTISMNWEYAVMIESKVSSQISTRGCKNLKKTSLFFWLSVYTYNKHLYKDNDWCAKESCPKHGGTEPHTLLTLALGTRWNPVLCFAGSEPWHVINSNIYTYLSPPPPHQIISNAQYMNTCIKKRFELC